MCGNHSGCGENLKRDHRQRMWPLSLGLPLSGYSERVARSGKAWTLLRGHRKPSQGWEARVPSSPWGLTAHFPPSFSGTGWVGGGSSHPCSLSSQAPLVLICTRKWNVNPGLFKEQERRGRGWDRAKQGVSGRPRAPLCTWFDLLEGCEQLQLQTENYLKQLPDVVSELGFYNLLTG